MRALLPLHLFTFSRPVRFGVEASSNEPIVKRKMYFTGTEPHNRPILVPLGGTECAGDSNASALLPTTRRGRSMPLKRIKSRFGRIGFRELFVVCAFGADPISCLGPLRRFSVSQHNLDALGEAADF